MIFSTEKKDGLLTVFYILVGKNDGSVDGIRYFRTDPQRGIFVKADDFIILSSNHCR